MVSISDFSVFVCSRFRVLTWLSLPPWLASLNLTLALRTTSCQLCPIASYYCFSARVQGKRAYDAEVIAKPIKISHYYNVCH